MGDNTHSTIMGQRGDLHGTMRTFRIFQLAKGENICYSLMGQWVEVNVQICELMGVQMEHAKGPVMRFPGTSKLENSANAKDMAAA